MFHRQHAHQRNAVHVQTTYSPLRPYPCGSSSLPVEYTVACVVHVAANVHASSRVILQILATVPMPVIVPRTRAGSAEHANRVPPTAPLAAVTRPLHFQVFGRLRGGSCGRSTLTVTGLRMDINKCCASWGKLHGIGWIKGEQAPSPYRRSLTRNIIRTRT